MVISVSLNTLRVGNITDRLFYKLRRLILCEHPRDAEKVTVTGAGRSHECKNIELVWELSKTGFWEGGGKYSCLLTRVFIKRPSTIFALFINGI